MKKKHTVLIAGPLPPPAGGISVHIQRLAHLLNNQFSVDFIDEASTVKPGYFHVKSLNLVQYIRKIAGSQVFFIHSGSRILKKIHILSGRLLGKKVIITETGWPSKGQTVQEANPSAENAMKYFINTQHWAKDQNIEMFYFSSFDESWKLHLEGEVGTQWGLWDINEKQKFG